MSTSPGQGSKAGLLGKQTGSGSGPGGAEAQAYGQRSPGTPEDTSFEREHLRANELDPGGQTITTLPFEGELPTGEALQAYPEIQKTIQSSAEKVDNQTIPVEYRERIRDYFNTLNPDPAPAPATDAGEGDTPGENGGSR